MTSKQGDLVLVGKRTTTLSFWIWYQLMRSRPWEVNGKFNLWRSQCWRPGFKSDTIRTLQPLLHCFFGYQPSTTSWTLPRRLFLQANQITQARRYTHAIWKCKYKWHEYQWRVQELSSKWLIDTVEEIKNGAPWMTVKEFFTTVTMNDLVSQWKTKL